MENELMKLSEMQKQVRELNRNANKAYQNKIFYIPSVHVNKKLEDEFVSCKVTYVDLLRNRVEIEYGKYGYLTSINIIDFETHAVDTSNCESS